jgi:glycosyltransferase involved in cell wall biosynthesis
VSILIITAVFPPEPVVSARLSFDLASMSFKNEEVIVISPKPTRPFGYNFNNNFQEFAFKHIVLNSYTCPHFNLLGRARESLSFGRQCYHYIIKNYNEIKLVYINSWPLFAQFYAVKASKRNNIPVVLHVQDIYPESLINKFPFGRSLFSSLLIPVDRYILRNSNKIIAISDSMKKHLVKSREIESEKISVIQNWQDEESFMKYKLQSGSGNAETELFTFMYLGNIGPVAGVELLIEGFSRAKLLNCRLVIAGSGSMKKNLELSVAASKKSGIEFCAVPDGEVPEIQSRADVFLLPLKKGAALSSIPSKLPSYMFSEKPILCCLDVESDTAKVINEANCGWVIPPDDADTLAEKMSEIAGMKKEDLQCLGTNGYHYAIDNFSKSKNLSRLIDIIDNLIIK